MAFAGDAPGDADGLKVRVVRRESARASAEDALHRALTEAGLNESMDWQKPFVR